MKTLNLTTYLIRIICVFLICAAQTTWAKSFIDMPWGSSGQIKIKTKLSQTKLVQHGANTVFLDMTLVAPKSSSERRQQRASDIIIVLDRSGSMSEAKKMPYAKAAIWDVLGRLNENDRFALVSFANNAIVQSPLVYVSAATRNYLNNVVSSINPVGGTNIGDGLNAAINLFDNNHSERARKIILLSDGQVNEGIINPEQLAQLAVKATQHGAVLSSIGMGLGFNESLMARLADYGMGNYSYLEDLSGLGTILARDLENTRNIYANSSHLDVSLGDGVKLIDAGGYPLTHIGSSTVRVSTGQLLSNTNKHFVMTFSVPNGNIGTLTLGRINLNYQVGGEYLQSHVNSESLVLAVVSPKYRVQAQQSINKEVYQNSWAENNLARMKKKLSHWVNVGKKDKAKQEIKTYFKQVEAAAFVSKLPLATTEMKEKLQEMEKQVDDAFAGSLLDQQVKRNRAAKSMQFDSIKTQRR